MCSYTHTCNLCSRCLGHCIPDPPPPIQYIADVAATSLNCPALVVAAASPDCCVSTAYSLCDRGVLHAKTNLASASLPPFPLSLSRALPYSADALQVLFQVLCASWVPG